MPERDFFDPSAKARAAEATRTVEAATSAEIVIAVRRACGRYSATSLALGAASGLAALAALIYSPQAFAAETMPVDVALAVAFGYGLGAAVSPLRRMLTRARVLSGSVDAAAKSAFYDLGISRTQRRQGILVFASLFEGRARLLPDVAVNAATLAQIEVRLSARLKARDFSGFIAEVEAMAPVLAATMPRGDSDENELPDEMQ
jgi:hypothetical protein